MEDVGHSEDITKLAAALVAAQAEMGPAKKNAKNPHFRSSYADMASVITASNGPLTSNGIAIVQIPLPSGDHEVRLRTMLVHASGQSIWGTITIPCDKKNAQGHGSALTYARRYSICAMVGLSQEDDDGNATSAKKPAQDDKKQKMIRALKAAKQEHDASSDTAAASRAALKLAPQGAAAAEMIATYVAFLDGGDIPDNSKKLLSQARALAEA